MKNQSRLYKSIAICASVIAALAMLVPTVSSAVGSSASSDSTHNAASAPSSATSTRSSSSSSSASTTSTRSSSSSSTTSSGSNDSNDLGSGWIKTQSRNIKCAFNSRYNTLYLRPINKNSPVYGTHLSGNGDDPKKISILKGFDDPGLFNQIKTIVIEEDMTLSGAAQMFFGFKNLKRIEGLEHIKFGTNLEDGSVQSMFSNCPNLEILEGIQNWDMSNVTNASVMFANDTSLKNIYLSGWENVKIKNIWGMFDSCTSLKTAKMFSAKDGTLVNLYRVFNNAENLTDIQNLENWNTKNVTNMSVMFANTPSLSNVGSLARWNTEKVTDMSGMFYNTKSLKTIAGVENWNTSNVTDMSYMFTNTQSLKTIAGIEKWSTGYVKDMYAMFYGSGVESLDLSNWILPQKKVQDGNSSRSAIAGMFQDSGLRDLTLLVYKKNKNYPILPDGIWRGSKGKSAINPGENIDFVTNNSIGDLGYIRWVRDYIDVTFENKTDNKTIKCVADVLQGNGETYNLSNANFVSCKDESKNPKDSNAFKNKPIKFETIKNAMGIVEGDTVKWQGDYKPVFKRVSWKQIDIGNNEKITTFIINTRVQYKKFLEPSMENNPVKYDKVENAKIYSVFDVTFTANVTHKQKPKPPVPEPEPQPTPTPTPEPAPSPSPTPEHGPDDSDILPDITTKPDLNINSNHDFVYPFIKQPQKSPQPTQGADVENNVLQRAEAENNSNFVIKKQFNSNSGTCKCVCPTLPKDAKSHKSNKSVRKSSNKAAPCKSGNSYSWLGIGGLIISWLIMLLIGFIVGYKMRKKRDDEHSDENQSAIKDQSL